MKPVALITGATGGIGRAVCQRVHQIGYELVLVDLQEDTLKQLCADYPHATYLPLDFTDSGSVECLGQWLDEKNVAIDVAVLNAGIVVPKSVLDTSPQSMDRQLDINLRSTMQCLRLLAQHMQQHHSPANRGGHLITTVSMGGIFALKGSAIYSASKFGLRGFLMALRSELKPLGIHVSGLYLSAVDTPMLRFEAENNGSPLNFLSRPMQPTRVATLVERALKNKKLELYAPYTDSWGARLMGVFPWLIEPLYPILAWLGEKGREQYLKTIHSRGRE